MAILFQSKPSLVAYLTCGDPDLATTRDIVFAAIEAGAEVIELGVPFSDPVADGPVIQRASERALRHAVIWRKLSFGTQSAGGSRFVETMLTVIETCRQQSRNVFAYVTAAVQAHFADQPTPSLLPEV